MPGPTPAIMAIAFLVVVVVVEDILFLIFQWGVYLEGGILGVVVLLFWVYSRGMKRAFVFGGRILLGVQGRSRKK